MTLCRAILQCGDSLGVLINAKQVMVLGLCTKYEKQPCAAEIKNITLYG